VVLALQPDLVIANLEENVEEQVLKIAGITNVWLTNIKTLDDAIQMISDIGMIADRGAESEVMVQAISKGFSSLPEICHNLTVTYLIWQNPLMTVGGDTFIHHLMERIGLKNLFGHLQRYPIIDVHVLQANPPDILLLSNEPFPFGPKNLKEWEEKLPETNIELVDGSYFSWYGSRLTHAPGYFAKCLDKWN
jgi:ABC-type Fe3+-hydroxamate transport system substrate-binding protein